MRSMEGITYMQVRCITYLRAPPPVRARQPPRTDAAAVRAEPRSLSNIGIQYHNIIFLASHLVFIFQTPYIYSWYMC